MQAFFRLDSPAPLPTHRSIAATKTLPRITRMHADSGLLFQQVKCIYYAKRGRRISRSGMKICEKKQDFIAHRSIEDEKPLILECKALSLIDFVVKFHRATS
jgi:hypothetical protein